MRTIVLGLLACLAVSAAAICAELRVPDDYRLIQEAVSMAREGDTILIAPGTYFENIAIELRTDITLRGDVQIRFESDACWDDARSAALDVIIVGAIRIFASREITIETLTVTGPGPGIGVSGLPSQSSVGISVFACNLICNDGPAVELGDHYQRFAISCSNVCQRRERNESDGPGDLSNLDVHMSCNRSYERVTDVAGDRLLGEEIVVAVIDSGIDWSVRGLACHQWVNPDEIPRNGIDDDRNGYIDDRNGWDFRDDDPSSLVGSRLHWHGTFVTGVLVDRFSELTHPLIAPPHLRIMDLRFLDGQALFRAGDWTKLAAAIDYAVENGARVINLSLYTTTEPLACVHDAIQRAVDAGVVIVGIAGNDPSSLNPLGAWPEIVTVAAVSKDCVPAAFSGVGSDIDVSTYGVDILSLLPGGMTGIRSGTSFAAPRVAGLAAFFVARNPALSPEEIARLLATQALDVGTPGYDVHTGHGVIQ